MKVKRIHLYMKSTLPPPTFSTTKYKTYCTENKSFFLLVRVEKAANNVTIVWRKHMLKM